MDAAIVLGVIFGVVAIGCYWAFRAGVSAARKDTAEAQARADKKAITTRTEKEAEVSGLSESDLDGRLSKWVRHE